MKLFISRNYIDFSSILYDHDEPSSGDLDASGLVLCHEQAKFSQLARQMPPLIHTINFAELARIPKAHVPLKHSD